MFKLNPNPTFVDDVRVTVPGAEAPASISVEWRHKGRKALKQWLDDVAGQGDEVSLHQVIAGWSGVIDSDGKDVGFTPAALATLLDAYPAAGGELFGAYLKSLTESRLGN